MSDRIGRSGMLVTSASGSLLLPAAGPCDRCGRGGCGIRSAAGSASAAAASRDGRVPAAVSGAASGRMQEPVAVSISRAGLSAACLLLFGPVILILAAVAQLSSVGYGGAAFQTGSILALAAGLLLGGYLGRRFGAGLVDLKLEAGR